MLQAASSQAKKVPEDKVDMEPASDKESNDEWDLNNPADCLEMLEKSFPAADGKKAGYSPDMFCKICEFYLQHLKTKTPKQSLAILASWIKKDLDAGILKSSKQRISWMQVYGLCWMTINWHVWQKPAVQLAVHADPAREVASDNVKHMMLLAVRKEKDQGLTLGNQGYVQRIPVWPIFRIWAS